MSFIAASAIMVGGNLIGGLIGQSGAGQQASADQQAAAIQLQIFDEQQANNAPYINTGATALSDIAGGLNLPGGTTNGTTAGQFTHQFDANDLTTNLAPNYSFQLGQGLTSTANLMNLNSGAFSGNTLKAINDYAQNYAGNAYQQAFTNYNTNQSNIFNRLSNVAGMGQASAANQAVAGANYGAGIGSSLAAAGAATGAGTVGLGNAIGGSVNNAGSMYALSSFLKQPQTTGSTGMGGYGGGVMSTGDYLSSGVLAE